MADQVALARVNVFAVLRCLESLSPFDDEAKSIAAGRREVVQFTVGGAGAARLEIGGGSIRFHPGGGPRSVHLWFPSAAAANAMFAGTGNPIPLKGFTKLGWLQGPFTRLTAILASYLRPDPARLGDAAYRAANAALSLRAAAYALAEIGNWDEAGRLNAARMADGEILVAARGGPELTIKAEGGRLSCLDGPPAARRARMVFSDLDAAGELLRGESDSYTSMGAGKLELGGYVPMLDHMNKILGLVPRYLK